MSTPLNNQLERIFNDMQELYFCHKGCLVSEFPPAVLDHVQATAREVVELSDEVMR
jgi:hypothetical protein